jgi:hypothetical protein
MMILVSWKIHKVGNCDITWRKINIAKKEQGTNAGESYKNTLGAGAGGTSAELVSVAHRSTKEKTNFEKYAGLFRAQTCLLSSSFMFLSFPSSCIVFPGLSEDEHSFSLLNFSSRAVAEANTDVARDCHFFVSYRYSESPL